MKYTLSLPDERDGEIHLDSHVSPMPAPHWHDELEFNLVTRGTAAYLLGDRRYDLRLGTLVWLFPAQEHILLDRSPDHERWLGIFKPELLRRVCTTPETQILSDVNPPGRFCNRLPAQDAASLEALMRDLVDHRDDIACYNAGLGYCLLSAWAAGRRAGDSSAGSDVHPAVERAARLLRGRDAPESLPELAAQVGLSAPRLSALFRRQTGVSLVEFRNTQRLERFLRLYGRGRLAVLEAALEAGFGSYPQFHRVFTRRMGCSPVEYRRRQEEGY